MMKKNDATALRKDFKVVFVADNRDRTNWGCRATSMALKEIIAGQCEIIYTIYGNLTGRYDPSQFHSSKLSKTIFQFVHRIMKRLHLLYRWLDTADIIQSNVEDSVKGYMKAIKKNAKYKELDDYIRQADAIVVNGEGTFIFSTPNRYDTIFYLMLLKVAQMYGKKTYCLNAMYSDYPNSPRNEKILNESKNILEHCTMVTARDPLSLEYCKERITKKVEYVPDALFVWSKYAYYKDLCIKYPLSCIAFPEMTYKWIDYSKPYICLSGSSLAARYPMQAYRAYMELAMALNKEVLPTIIVSTCSGDGFLQQVAIDAGLPYVSVETNIFAGLSILGNAKVFVSGRWHPSILASLFGTPCVFMDSNSHKTFAIQLMLEYEEPKEYSSIPSAEDIRGIVNDTKNILKNESQLRNDIRGRVERLRKQVEDCNRL